MPCEHYPSHSRSTWHPASEISLPDLGHRCCPDLLFRRSSGLHGLPLASSSSLSLTISHLQHNLHTDIFISRGRSSPIGRPDTATSHTTHPTRASRPAPRHFACLMIKKNPPRLSSTRSSKSKICFQAVRCASIALDFSHTIRTAIHSYSRILDRPLLRLATPTSYASSTAFHPTEVPFRHTQHLVTYDTRLMAGNTFLQRYNTSCRLISMHKVHRFYRPYSARRCWTQPLPTLRCVITYHCGRVVGRCCG